MVVLIGERWIIISTRKKYRRVWIKFRDCCACANPYFPNQVQLWLLRLFHTSNQTNRNLQPVQMIRIYYRISSLLVLQFMPCYSSLFCPLSLFICKKKFVIFFFLQKNFIYLQNSSFFFHSKARRQ